MVRALVDTKAHFKHLLLPGGQRLKNTPYLFFEAGVYYSVSWRDNLLILDEIPQVAVFLFPYGGFQADGLFSYFEYFAHLVQGKFHLFRDLFRHGFTAQLLHQLPRCSDELVDGFYHVDRYANGSCLIGNGPCYGLADPPGRIGGKLVAATVFELVHRLHKAYIAFLNEIQELKPSVGVFLRDAHDQAKVGLYKLLLGVSGPDLCQADLLTIHHDVSAGHCRLFFYLLEPFSCITYQLAIALELSDGHACLTRSGLGPPVPGLFYQLTHAPLGQIRPPVDIVDTSLIKEDLLPQRGHPCREPGYLTCI